MLTDLTASFYEKACRWLGLPRWGRWRVHPIKSMLEEGWVLANHKLVSFHAAFLSSLFMLTPGEEWTTGKVLMFMFLSWEVIFSLIILYLSWHINIAVHELGHYLAAVNTNNLRQEQLDLAQKKMSEGKAGWLAKGLLLIPWGKFPGIKKEAGSYFPDVKAQNLAVSAAGPLTSQKLSLATLPPGIVLVALGFIWSMNVGGGAGPLIVIWLGRLLGTIGVVALLDRMLADHGAVKGFRERQSGAAAKAAEARRQASAGKWDIAAIKKKLLETRLNETKAEDGTVVRAPWQYRNCLMGGRHTEEQGGNLSFQEFMFLPLSAENYVEAQRMTNALQSRVIQIVQDSEGMNFVGIGLEGGMVGAYAKREDDAIPEERALKVAVQAIEECGFVPGQDVALALDPAATELAIAFREATERTDAIGQYRFWRAEDPKVMTSDDLVELYKDWVARYPIVSIEDGFSEDDPEGWKKLMAELGDKIFIIGDDLVTTKDTNILKACEDGLINTVLVKANQIGSLCETLMATAAGKSRGAALVVSHRSKSPNDTMEADIGFAVDAMALKCGGGSNTERLIKYGRIVELMRMAEKGIKVTKPIDSSLKILDIPAREEATNAGIPTVGVTVMLENGVSFRGATPLGTSAGTDEATHLVDSTIEKSPVTDKYPELFSYNETLRTYKFKKEVTGDQVAAKNDPELSETWRRAQRYNGKGCLNAVDNVEKHLAPLFEGKAIAEVGTMVDVDRQMLELERKVAIERGKLTESAPAEEQITIMQRKANLGMNAILSASLALGRLIAAREGVELPHILEALEGKIDRDELYGMKK
jgi:enolase